MSNEASSADIEPAQVLEWEIDPSEKPMSYGSASLGLNKGRVGLSQNFPIMQFETQADVVAEPTETSRDGII